MRVIIRFRWISRIRCSIWRRIWRRSRVLIQIILWDCRKLNWDRKQTIIKYLMTIECIKNIRNQVNNTRISSMMGTMQTKWTIAMIDTSHMGASISNMMPDIKSKSQRDLRTLKDISRTVKLTSIFRSQYISWAEGLIASGRHTMKAHRILKAITRIRHSLNRAMTRSNGISNHLLSRTLWISRSRSGWPRSQRVYHLYTAKHKITQMLNSLETLCKIRIQMSATSLRKLNTRPKILMERSSRCSCQTKCTPPPPPLRERFQIWIINTHKSSKIWLTIHNNNLMPLVWTRISTTANRIKRTKKTIRIHKASFSAWIIINKEPILRQISNSSYQIHNKT